MSDMDKYINNLVCEFKRLSYEDVEDCSDSEKLLYLYAYYHYFNLITNHNPKTVGNKRAITNALQAMKPEHEYVTYHISFGLDIEYEIMEIENPKEYVDEAVIKLDAPNNFMRFGTEESLIVNISALSLKNLYEQYGYRGLFAQNLRYYVKNAKIDGSIIESIQEHPENFWYYNNGVILICDDYLIEGDNILVQNFL